MNSLVVQKYKPTPLPPAVSRFVSYRERQHILKILRLACPCDFCGLLVRKFELPQRLSIYTHGGRKTVALEVD